MPETLNNYIVGHFPWPNKRLERPLLKLLLDQRKNSGEVQGVCLSMKILSETFTPLFRKLIRKKELNNLSLLKVN